MVGKGIGIVPALREVAKRFAQRAIIDLLDGHRREFVTDAGSAVEFLAKAVVADDDPAKLFKIRKGEPPLNAQELAVLDARLQDDQPRRLQADEVEDVRLALSNRRTITAKQAVERASVLAHIEDGWFPAASARIRRSRDACLHLGDEPVAELDDVADDFVRVADRLWAEQVPDRALGMGGSGLTRLVARAQEHAGARRSDAVRSGGLSARRARTNRGRAP